MRLFHFTVNTEKVTDTVKTDISITAPTGSYLPIPDAIARGTNVSTIAFRDGGNNQGGYNVMFLSSSLNRDDHLTDLFRTEAEISSLPDNDDHPSAGYEGNEGGIDVDIITIAKKDFEG
tara:strand:- start:118 stop:474 length:357 start_codon:yes stop_codon:yes gene_type:complete